MRKRMKRSRAAVSFAAQSKGQYPLELLAAAPKPQCEAADGETKPTGANYWCSGLRDGRVRSVPDKLFLVCIQSWCQAEGSKRLVLRPLLSTICVFCVSSRVLCVGALRRL
ncbi:hypothetical protein MUK42_20890 [Musa troglodytarum]|uniref:Uncharacterized protein n=1 Tax=Musa troglodytarum TaxID=320322 RepID=A0A9E7G808_9LILI|nr:hypothetical protein MUK42_20890 [Musa troglodytarum]